MIFLQSYVTLEIREQCCKQRSPGIIILIFTTFTLLLLLAFQLVFSASIISLKCQIHSETHKGLKRITHICRLRPILVNIR